MTLTSCIVSGPSFHPRWGWYHGYRGGYHGGYHGRGYHGGHGYHHRH